MKATFLVLVVAAACGGSSKPPAEPVSNSAPAPSCVDAAAGYARIRADHIAYGAVTADELRPKLTTRVTQACVDGAWSVEARTCWGAPIHGRSEQPDCAARLSTAQATALAGEIRELRAELAASQLDPEMAELEQKVLAGRSGIPACDAYLRSAVALARCEKLPDETRRAVLGGGAVMVDSWRHLDAMTPKDRATAQQEAAVGCQAAVDGIQQTLVALGCPTP